MSVESFQEKKTPMASRGSTWAMRDSGGAHTTAQSQATLAAQKMEVAIEKRRRGIPGMLTQAPRLTQSRISDRRIAWPPVDPFRPLPGRGAFGHLLVLDLSDSGGSAEARKPNPGVPTINRVFAGRGGGVFVALQ